MAKSDITLEQARAVVDRVAKELGLLSVDTTGFIKIQGPGNKQRMYIQRSRTLGRIDFTVDLDPADPAYKQMTSPNGSIKCHVVPDLEQLERCLRMLADTSLPTQVPNKPRPFAATKAPGPRRPKAVSDPIPEAALAPIPEGGTLESRLEVLKSRARKAKIERLMENDATGKLTREEASDIVDGKVTKDDVDEAAANGAAAELAETLAETGIEVSQ